MIQSAKKSRADPTVKGRRILDAIGPTGQEIIQVDTDRKEFG